MGSALPLGMKAVYMRIPNKAKKKWKMLAKEKNLPMTVVFLEWLGTQELKKK